MRKPTAEALGCIPLEHDFWPITYDFTVSCPGYWSGSRLSINVPRFSADLEAAGKFGVALWGLSVAIATSDQCWLTGLQVTQWKVSSVPLPHLFAPIRGGAPGAAGARAAAGCLMAHSGRPGRLAARRLVVPGLPAAWSDAGLVTPVGLRALEAVAKVLVMGCGGEVPGCPSELLVTYLGEVEPHLGNLQGVCFRHCELLVPVLHTTRAPE